MAFINSTDKLLETMTQWKDGGKKAAVILVDETTTDDDVSKDRSDQHRMQASLIVHAAKLGFPIFLVEYGMEGAHGTKEVHADGLGKDLDSAIPGKTYRYSKGALETDGFCNVQLAADVKAAKVTEAIIMGQSVNACCAQTGRGAAKLGLNVHTCGLVVRGGGAKTEAPSEMWGFGWPDKTTLYSAL